MAITAKSVIIDIADNYGGSSYLGIRSIDFLSSGVLVGITTEFTAYATTEYDADSLAAFAFNTALSKIGDFLSTTWKSANNIITNQRLIIVFDTPTDFDEIVVNNLHFFGSLTTWGSKNVVVTASTDAITDTTYNAAIANSTVLFTGVLLQHVAADVEDPQTIYYSPAVNGGDVVAPLISMVSYGEQPLFTGEITSPLADVFGTGNVYHYVGSGDVVVTAPAINGYSFVSVLGWAVIESHMPGISSIGVNAIRGAGHVSAKGISIYGTYGAVGNIEVSATIATYGLVSIIGNGMIISRHPVIVGDGQLPLRNTTNYVMTLPSINGTGVVHRTGRGLLSIQSPTIMTYGYIRSTGDVSVTVKRPQIVCQMNQPDDYTVIQHFREGTCR